LITLTLGLSLARQEAAQRVLDGGRHDRLRGRAEDPRHESAAIKEGLSRHVASLKEGQRDLAEGQRDLATSLQRLDERRSRVEKRLDDLVAAEPRYALSEDVQQLKGRVDALHDRLDSLEKRFDREQAARVVPERVDR